MIDRRYSRIEAIEGIGEQGVERLNEGKVFVVGCGALGSLCAMYLAGSGAGTVGIADFDTIDISNLQRQLFFDERSLGKSKVRTLADKIRNLNSSVTVEVFEGMVSRSKAEEIFAGYDFVIDGSDNPATKLMTSAVCESIGLPYCIGGVRECAGQIMSWTPGHLGYRDVFGDKIACGGFTPCSAGGVLGPAAGVVASVQASEAIKFLTGHGELLTDRLQTFDLAAPAAAIFQLG